jgi:hypothetical protein
MGLFKKAAKFVNKAGSFGILGNDFLGSGRSILGTKEGIFNDDEFKRTGGRNADGSSYTPEQIASTNLFKNLSLEQQKDLLLNNPTIRTPEGGQSYDPYTNTINLNESDFTKAERLRQEGLAAQLSGSLSGDFSNDGQAIQDATFNRGKAQIDPIVKQQRRDLATQLADQGIPAGSEGYNEAMNRLDDSIARQYTDLSQASIQTSEAVRSQRFNEIASLLGRSQVGAGASFAQNQGNGFQGLDLFNAEQMGIQFNRQAGLQQSLLSKQLKQQNRNAQYQALGSLAGAGAEAAPALMTKAAPALAASDRNLKENIKKIGISEKGLAIYEFEYKNKNLGEGVYQGVMAQDLLESKPEAVISDNSGILSVDYSLIDVDFKRIR